MCLTDSLVWRQRWEALAQILTTLSTHYEEASLQDPWLHTMHALAGCLQAFAQSQFEFFYTGFSNGKLLPSMVYPEEHVIRATLDQVAYDTAVIQAAASQRQIAVHRPVLEKADRLAQLALDVAVHSGLLAEQCTAVTYFHKSPHIRVIPYAPVALIGIPPTCLTTARDLLAIPHEVGHFVYHHAPGLAADLHGFIPLDPPWINHWVEEVFADVYGCLVAGPVIGLSCQDLIYDNAYPSLVADDGEHPVDAIRPFAYSTALAELNYEQAAPALTTCWQTRLRVRHNPTNFIPFGANTPVSLPEALTAVNNATIRFVNYLENTRRVQQPGPWSNDAASLSDLYAQFEEWVTTPPETAVYTLRDLENGKVGLVHNGSAPVSIRRKGRTKTWRDWFKAEAANHDGPIAWNGWLPIFTSGFWPTKGPDDNSDGGNP
ncbi:MAG: hypothetical protein HND44_05745 [Chloroflexi bacterium]|nr:hypothetical protein [Ardenticatenaceae bacterium]MBL1127990.1 hypothetical protein [Chloroflexota bacterium]NOG34062.1 hypothetical protein [Chloroflexota bacterium]GIK54480.1 MAG: hypothetical protein BroJett015_01430 [Chloroflexota bacterium]